MTLDRKEKLETIEQEIGLPPRRFRMEVKERVISYSVASLGLVASLAWNEAIKSAIEYFFPFRSDTLTAKFLYAIILTGIIAAITAYLVGLLERETEKLP